MEPSQWFVDEVSELYAVRALPSSISVATRASSPSAQTSSRPLPEIISANDLIESTQYAQPPQLVRGVLHQGLKGLLASSSKARKTWVLLDLAISVATGTQWWNWPTTRGRVLIINFEIPAAFIRSRIDSIKSAKSLENVGDLDVWTLRGYGESFDALIPRIIERLRQVSYSLIIIDPIYKGLGNRDENKAGDIGQLCNELERLAVETDAAVMYAHHFSKGNQSSKESMDRIGGSGVFARDADTIITMTKHERDNCFTVELTLRNLPEVAPFVVQWVYPLMYVREHFNPSNLRTTQQATRRYHPQQILALIRDNPLTTVEWRNLATRETEISNGHFYRIRQKFEDDGEIEQVPGTEQWRIRETPRR